MSKKIKKNQNCENEFMSENYVTIFLKKSFLELGLKVLNRSLLSYSIDGSGPPIRFSIAPGSLQKFLKILTDQSLNMCRLKRRKKKSK